MMNGRWIAALATLVMVGCGDAAQESDSALESTPTQTVAAAIDDYDGDGFSKVQGDCNDQNADIHPEALETCGDGVDNDCDLFVDEPSAVDAQAFYPDDDDDGYGSYRLFVTACSAPTGFVDNFTDCDDTNADVHPGAVEVAGDNLDANCDGTP